MTAKTQGNMQATKDLLFPDNTSGEITAEDLRLVFGDMVDSCFREGSLVLESGAGRVLINNGDGYLNLS